MDADRLVKTSKFLSLVLRHNPGTVGISLDPNGWVQVDELLRAINAHKPQLRLDRALLEELVAGNDKKRFAFSEDGTRIRASQGHSVDIDLALEPRVAPAQLFHGTATRFLESIMAQGLIKGSRRHVHLSADPETAVKVGQRHGKPVVLKVSAAAMQAAGHEFFLSANGVWLTEHVPPAYLSL